MIWEKDVSVLVMITNIKERGRVSLCRGRSLIAPCSFDSGEMRSVLATGRNGNLRNYPSDVDQHDFPRLLCETNICYSMQSESKGRIRSSSLPLQPSVNLWSILPSESPTSVSFINTTTPIGLIMVFHYLHYPFSPSFVVHPLVILKPAVRLLCTALPVSVVRALTSLSIRCWRRFASSTPWIFRRFWNIFDSNETFSFKPKNNSSSSTMFSSKRFNCWTSVTAIWNWTSKTSITSFKCSITSKRTRIWRVWINNFSWLSRKTKWTIINYPSDKWKRI